MYIQRRLPAGFSPHLVVAVAVLRQLLRVQVLTVVAAAIRPSPAVLAGPVARLLVAGRQTVQARKLVALVAVWAAVAELRVAAAAR